jgi:hypothetical protein
MLLALRAATAQIRAAFTADRAWWARNDPVAYVWLCRAERRGARVPWSEPPCHPARI